MGRTIDLAVDTQAVRESVHTLDRRVTELAGAIERLRRLDSPPLGTFPDALDAVSWHADLRTEALDRLRRLHDALVALRDGNATIAARYDEVERATGDDVDRHAV